MGGMPCALELSVQVGCVSLESPLDILSFSYVQTSGCVLQPGITLAKYALRSANDCPGRDPAEWKLFGVSEEGEQQLLHSVDESNAWGGQRWSWREFEVAVNAGPFVTFRLEIAKNNGEDCTQLGQIRLFEVAGSERSSEEDYVLTE